MRAGAGNQDARRRRTDAVWFAVGVTTVALALGFAVKDPCARDLAWQGGQYSRNCYSDITALYGIRGFNEGHPIAYRDNELEYPALTGLYITAVNAPVRDGCDQPGAGPCGARGFFVANSAGLVPFGLVGAAALAAIASRRRRLLYYAAAPAILAYAFHNWDLIPTGLTAAALWAFVRRRDGLAGLLLGLGAAAKLYPAFIVPALVAARLGWRPANSFAETLWLVKRRERPGAGVLPTAEGRRAATRLLGASLAGFIVPNLVVLALAGFDGWWFPWKFQTERFPNFETSWFFIHRHLSGSGSEFWFTTYPKVAQWTSTLLFCAGAAVLLWRELRRERFRPMVAAMGMVLLFLLTAKVFSPQYALWLLPFFVLVGIPWWGYGLFVLSDMLVLAAIWAYLLTQQYPQQFGAPPDVGCGAFPACAQEATVRLDLLEIAVWARYAVLALLLWLSRRAPEHVEDAEPAAQAAPAAAAV